MTVEDRLVLIEARLAALEAGAVPGSAKAEPQHVFPPPATHPERPPVVVGPVAPPPIDWTSNVSSLHLSAPLVLGWAGATALLLAAAYLFKLGIEYGWLTPERQVGAAAVLGLGMVGGGLVLRARDRRYASLLGAGGVGVLLVTIFGAHLQYHLIGPLPATGLVVAVAALSLGLHALYRETLYIAFAMLGSYAAPLLIQGDGTLLDLAIYLTVWNGVYCAYALWIGQRWVSLAALYVSLLLFDVKWQSDPQVSMWRVAVLFQLAQFVLFAAVAVWISIRQRRPLSEAEALVYFIPLMLFYGIEYAILHKYAPGAAPWAAVTCAVVLYGVYFAARAALGQGHLGSIWVVNAFGAVVLLHAVFLDALAAAWRPAAGLALALLLLALPRITPRVRSTYWPYISAAVVLLFVGYAELVWNWESETVIAAIPLALLYPALFYAAYFTPGYVAYAMVRGLLLAVAHILLLVACGLIIGRWVGESGTTVERLWLSFAWALVATIFLIIARLREDRLLARSALGIFALFAGKVLLFDLADAAPLVRVGCLLVLGVSLYAGGWLYRRIQSPDALPPAAV